MSMDRPDKAYYPPAVASTTMPAMFPLQIPDHSIRAEAFDQILAQRGIRMIHRRSIPCFNLVDLEQNSHDPLCTVCDGAGVYYYAEKEIFGLFHGNSLEKSFEHHGVWEVGQAMITLPTEYPDGTEADFNTLDQLFLPDFTVRMWEIKEFIPNPTLTQSVRYPIQKTDFVGSAVNNVVKVYQPGVDFNITPTGNIQWVSGKQPSYSKLSEKGEVFAVSYFASPIYTVVQHMRELRITQEVQADGRKIARRLPQSILVRRDYLRNSPEKEGQ